MAGHATRLCTKPGCRGMIVNGKCTLCGQQKRRAWHQDGTKKERGYGWDWEQVRAAFVRQATEAAMLEGRYRLTCGICGKEIEWHELHVDHKIPFVGVNDPRRLDNGNLQPAHRKCNEGKARGRKHAE